MLETEFVRRQCAMAASRSLAHTQFHQGEEALPVSRNSPRDEHRAVAVQSGRRLNLFLAVPVTRFRFAREVGFASVEQSHQRFWIPMLKTGFLT